MTPLLSFAGFLVFRTKFFYFDSSPENATQQPIAHENPLISVCECRRLNVTRSLNSSKWRCMATGDIPRCSETIDEQFHVVRLVPRDGQGFGESARLKGTRLFLLFTGVISRWTGDDLRDDRFITRERERTVLIFASRRFSTTGKTLGKTTLDSTRYSSDVLRTRVGPRLSIRRDPTRDSSSSSKRITNWHVVSADSRGKSVESERDGPNNGLFYFLPLNKCRGRLGEHSLNGLSDVARLKVSLHAPEWREATNPRTSADEWTRPVEHPERPSIDLDGGNLKEIL